MQLKEWAFLGNYEFFNSKLKALATNELPPEKWSYAGKSDFGILRSYLYFTFEKLWQEREDAGDPEKQQFIFMDDNVACFNTGLYDKTWQPIYFTVSKILLMGSSHGGLQHFITVIRSNFPTVQQMRFLLFVEQTILMIQVR